MSKAQKVLVLLVGIVFVAIYIASQAPNTGTQTATDTHGETAKPKDRPQEEAWIPQPEMPTFLTQEDWCLVPTTSSEGRNYKAVPGCKSFVVRQDTIVWRDRSCKVTSISKHVPKSMPEFSGHWWLRGYCSDGSVADFRFFEARVDKEHMLIQLFPPYFALGE